MKTARLLFVLWISLVLPQNLHSQWMNISVQVQKGWNLISAPIRVDDYNTRTLYPTAISPAYGYTKRYLEKDTLELCRGYWLKFDSAQTIPFSGPVVLSCSIRVTKGWNIIGSLSIAIPSTSVRSDSIGLIASSFYGYSDGLYIVTDTLQSGHSYWVKCRREGTIIMTASEPTFWFHHDDPFTNIYWFNGYAGNRRVKLYWEVGSAASVAVYSSMTSPDSGFYQVLRSTKPGRDSCVIEGLMNDSMYYFRVATYGSAVMVA